MGQGIEGILVDEENIEGYSIHLIGSLIFAVGVNYFTIPNRLSEGGILGITIIAYYLFECAPGMVNLVLNLVLLAEVEI